MMCPPDLSLPPACLIGFLLQLQFYIPLLDPFGLKLCSEPWTVRMGPDKPLA